MDESLDLAGARALGLEARRQAQGSQALRLATRLAERLPRTREQARALLEQGFGIASAMSWEKVVQNYFLPALKRIEGRR